MDTLRFVRIWDGMDPQGRRRSGGACYQYNQSNSNFYSIDSFEKHQGPRRQTKFPVITNAVHWNLRRRIGRPPFIEFQYLSLCLCLFTYYATPPLSAAVLCSVEVVGSWTPHSPDSQSTLFYVIWSSRIHSLFGAMIRWSGWRWKSIVIVLIINGRRAITFFKGNSLNVTTHCNMGTGMKLICVDYNGLLSWEFGGWLMALNMLS